MNAIFTDMDGTILNSEHVMSQRTIGTLTRLHELGQCIVFASGRAYDGMRGTISQLPFTPVMATLNGAYIIDEERKEIASFPIEPDDLLRISGIIRGQGLSYLFFYGEHWGSEEDNKFYRHELGVVGINGLVARLCDIAGKMDVHKVIAVGDPAEIDKAFPVLKAELPWLSVARSSPIYIEVNSGGIDKGRAVEIVAEHIGIDIEDTIAFGDYDNDLQMLEKAGIGVAMENSSESILNRVPVKTLSNDDDGVAVFLEKYFRI